MPAINYWTNRKGKRIVTRNINVLLTKFIGQKLNPVDGLFINMKKVVDKYFNSNPQHLKYFLNGSDPFDYNFEVEEKAGYITKCYFQI